MVLVCLHGHLVDYMLTEQQGETELTPASSCVLPTDATWRKGVVDDKLSKDQRETRGSRMLGWAHAKQHGKWSVLATVLTAPCFLMPGSQGNG